MIKGNETEIEMRNLKQIWQRAVEMRTENAQRELKTSYDCLNSATTDDRFYYHQNRARTELDILAFVRNLWLAFKGK